MKGQLPIKINKNFGSYKAGTIIKVRQQNGIPLDEYWRKRIRDSEIDDCVTVIQPVEKKKPTKEKVNEEV